MTAVSYRSFTGTAAENYERHFVPKIARPVSVAWRPPPCSPASASSTSPAAPD